MISHKEWLKKFKNCVSKYILDGRYRGHRMCGEEAFGGRCMYYVCPRREEGPRVKKVKEGEWQ